MPTLRQMACLVSFTFCNNERMAVYKFITAQLCITEKNLNIMTLKTFGNPAKITVAIFKSKKMAQIQINLSCVEKKV